MGLIADWLESEVRRLGVTVLTGTEASPETLAEHAPDAVVVATGSLARAGGFVAKRADRPAIPGIETANALTGRDVLAGAALPSGSAIVYDIEGHVQGLAVGEHLLDRGHSVELVTPHAFAGARIGASAWNRQMTDFVGKGGSITPNALIESVSGTEVTIADAFAGVLSERTGVGSIVVVGDSVADDELGRRLTELGGYDVVMAGDCLAPRLLESAVLEGHRVGRAL
jgi:hypothetical protein